MTDTACEKMPTQAHALSWFALCILSIKMHKNHYIEPPYQDPCQQPKNQKQTQIQPNFSFKPLLPPLSRLHLISGRILFALSFDSFYNMMKQEQSASWEQQVGQQQEKLKGIYHKIDGSIDRFLQLYAQAERAAECGEESRQVIAQLNRELLALKPLKTVREHFLHHYRKLSNLVRKAQTPNNLKNGIASSRYSRRNYSELPPHASQHRQNDEKFNHFVAALLNQQQELAVLEELIVESYLRQGHWECAAVWGETEKKVDPAGLFRESMTLKESIKRGELTEAIKWCQNERLYETHNCLLEYQLKLMHLLGLLQRAPPQQVLSFYSMSFAKFLNQKKEELQKLCLFLFFKVHHFWQQDSNADPALLQKLNQRYKIFEYCQQKLNSLSEEFLEVYMKQSSLSRFNSLEIIYQCSQKTMEEYMRMMRLVWGGKDKHHQKKEPPAILPFSVPIDRQYQHHSLFYCPVTKEVHSSSEASKLLACGHLISDNAHNRIVQQNRNRRKIKCPICQKEIKPDDSLKTEF